MANPIIEEMQKLGETVTEFQKTNDERLKAAEKGNTGLATELNAKLDKMNESLDVSQAKLKAFEAEEEKKQARIEMLEALSDRPKGTPEEQDRKKYGDLFIKGLREGFGNASINNELKELAKKDVTIGSSIGGGFALPKEIGMSVDALLLKLSGIVQNVKNVRVGTSDYQELVSIHGGTSGWVAETGTRSATGTPNLRNRKPTWGELYAFPQVSEWSVQDIQFNVADWLTNDVAEGMSNALSTSLWNGDGSDKPTGMTTSAPVATDDHASPLRAGSAYEFIALTNSPQTLNGDGIIDLVYALNPRYRSGAKFAMNTVTQGYVRKLKDTTGQYLWQPSLQVGQPDRLLGYEVFTWENMGNPTTGDALPIAFGDFARAYVLASRTELMIQSESVTNPGYVRFYVRRRYGGIPLNNDAVKFLKVAD